ncbi:hypothetical protein [Micromonospora sp. CPCC 205561]|uniref:hypothetical protein n=1 Tax=Micromonospora sp. CPCC 205561 TaxID=3122407 RepID=UPI002FF18478
MAQAAGARVDHRTGTIVLPLDQFGVSNAEIRTVDYAINLLLRACMAANGHTFEAIDHRAGPMTTDRRYGVWIESEVARHGYQEPPPTGPQRRLMEQNSAPMTGAEEATRRSCLGAAPVRALHLPDLHAQRAAAASYEQALASPPGRDLLDRWRRCLHDEGVTAAPPGSDGTWTPAGVSSTDIARSRRIALVDVGCKQRLKLVAGLADIEGEIQREMVRKDLVRLRAERQRVERVLVSAGEVIEDLG